VGRVLVTVGTLLLLFVAYQLWGTGIYQAREQSSLRSQFEHSLHRVTPTTTTTGTSGPGSDGSPPVVAPLTPPPHGDPLGIIQIPRIGVNQVVVEGVDVADLRKGPGHYPATQMPGHEGNAAIAGHRTTYGAPFGNLDQLSDGDTITVTTVQGRFQYRVTSVQVVDPNDGDVLSPIPYTDAAHAGHDKATLTLTTCNPKYSAAQRLVVKAEIVLPRNQPLPLPAQALPHRAPGGITGLSGERSSRTPTVLWALVAIVVGLAWWWAFHRRPRWTTWVAGAVPFLVALFLCYTYLERLLPANY